MPVKLNPPRKARIQTPPQNPHTTDPYQRLLISRLEKVKAETGLCRASIYALMAQGKFPAQILLSGRAVGWLDHEIQKWISDRVTASRGGAQ